MLKVPNVDLKKNLYMDKEGESKKVAQAEVTTLVGPSSFEYKFYGGLGDYRCGVYATPTLASGSEPRARRAP